MHLRVQIFDPLPKTNAKRRALDPEHVCDGRRQVGRSYRSVCRTFSRGIARSDDLPAGYAGAGQQRPQRLDDYLVAPHHLVHQQAQPLGPDLDVGAEGRDADLERGLVFGRPLHLVTGPEVSLDQALALLPVGAGLDPPASALVVDAAQTAGAMVPLEVGPSAAVAWTWRGPSWTSWARASASRDT